MNSMRSTLLYILLVTCLWRVCPLIGARVPFFARVSPFWRACPVFGARVPFLARVSHFRRACPFIARVFSVDFTNVQKQNEQRIQQMIQSLFQFRRSGVKNIIFIFKVFCWNQITDRIFLNNLFFVTENIGVNLNAGHSSFIGSIDKNVRV